MGFRDHAFALIVSTSLLPGLQACTKCVGSHDPPGQRPGTTTQRRSTPKGVREQVKGHSIKINDVARRYLVQTPRGYEPGKPAPLIVMLLDHGQTPERFSDRKNITIGAAKLGYLLAVPAADGAWQDELCPSSSAPVPDGGSEPNKPVAKQPEPTAAKAPKQAAADAGAGSSNPDVAFVGQMLDELASSYHADPQRTYLLGVGAGAAFAERVAQEMPTRVGGLVSVGSTATCDRRKANRPAQPVTALIIDSQSAGPDSKQPAGAASPSAVYWFFANQCPGSADALRSEAELSCARGARLKHVLVPASTDAWPVKIGTKYTMRYLHEFLGG
jgi:poly(3-hydroxybutyrate) depolymerase